MKPMKSIRCFGPVVALAALATAQTAQAQQVCVAPEDAADAMVYVMPGAYDAVLTTCTGEFTEKSFIPSAAGANFVEQFRAEQDARWPGTMRFFRIFMARETQDDGMAEVIAALPDDALRPLIDGILGQMIGKEIKSDNCAKIDRAVELLSPLPAENIAGLVSFILPEVDMKDPPVCGGKNGTVAVGSTSE
ncbi:MAG: hypothetical protein WBA51_14170 [Erythrobacter sp.]